LEWILADPNIEEIVANSPDENVMVYHRKYGWLKSTIRLQSDLELENYSRKIGRDVGREISILNPLLDARLPSGDRANAILQPISDKGANLTIRKFAADPWVFTDFINNKTISYEALALIWLAIQYEMNVLISGGTASGKTSLLNVCMPFIPPNHRIVSIEDTRELQLPAFLYWTPLAVRHPNPEGKGAISMLDLLVNSLRMRPDRIVVGEIRKKDQAEILFEAMHTGHSVYSTLHANTCNESFRRLLNEPLDIPMGMLEAVHLNVVMIRDRRRGLRRVYEVGEVIPRQTSSKVDYDINIMYRWSPGEDRIVKNQDSVRLFDEISRHTSMTESDIQEDLAEKRMVLEWAVKNKLDNLEMIGNLMNRYYRDHDSLIESIRRDLGSGRAQTQEVERILEEEVEEPDQEEVEEPDQEEVEEEEKTGFEEGANK
jgi:flagellar protein FlaI